MGIHREGTRAEGTHVHRIYSQQPGRRGLPGVRPSGESVSSAEWVYLGYLFHG